MPTATPNKGALLGPATLKLGLRLALGLGLGASLILCAPGCFQSSDTEYGSLGFDSTLPTFAQPQTVPEYTGSDPDVLDAQTRLRTGLDLHRKVIVRTCAVTGGVCHNTKEYPDLHTPANFLSSVRAPCNAQPNDVAVVYDRCEQVGDRVSLQGVEGSTTEIGWVNVVPGLSPNFETESRVPTDTDPGLHIHTHDSVPVSENTANRQNTQFRGQWTQSNLVRTFVTDDNTVEEITYATFTTRWWILGDGTHLYGEVQDWQVSDVQELLQVGIVQGDLNQNGTFGAREGNPIALINPGAPHTSYLVGRVRGTIEGQEVPGTRMPLANQPLSAAEMLALYCWIQGLPLDPSAQLTLSSPINYENCSYSANPQDLDVQGDGTTYSSRILPLLTANCGGCHGGSNPQGGFDVLSNDAHTRLMGASNQQPTLNYVEPNAPTQSYLYLKLTGDPAIGNTLQMPYNPITGTVPLDSQALQDIENWINAGAPND